MSDYTELITTLRRLSEKNSLSFWKRGVCKDAAAAIEELEKERDYYKQQYENRQRLIKSALGEEWT